MTLNLGGAIGNGAVGISSPEQQQQMANAILAEINTQGGVHCRKATLDFVEGNPIDQGSAQRACLQIAQGGYYAVLDMGGFSYPPGAADCVAQKKIPIFTISARSPRSRASSRRTCSTSRSTSRRQPGPRFSA